MQLVKPIAFGFLLSVSLHSYAEVERVWSAAGQDAAAIQESLDGLRGDLGDLNAPELGSRGSGRREINWDADTPLDAFASPNFMPATFFNRPLFPFARGAVFLTTGLGVQVSQDGDDPQDDDADQLRFSDANAEYLNEFQTFSDPRLFSAGTDANVIDVLFFVPGTNQPALVKGFGAIFTDVDVAGSTTLQYFDRNGRLLHDQAVPHLAGQGTLSLLGVVFDQIEVARVRITAGNLNLGAVDDLPASDAVVLDDFIYGEPVALEAIGQPLAEVERVWSAAGQDAAAIQESLDGLRGDLGDLNAPEPGSRGSGRREINWDADTPLDAFASPNFMPATFFNRPLFPFARGAVFLTTGLGVQVSQDGDDPQDDDADQLRFSDANAEYLNEFQTFSDPRLFSAGTDANVIDVLFFVPGTNQPALVKGFGAIFTDVDVAGSTTLQYFDRNGNELRTETVPRGGLAVLGVVFDRVAVARVRITSGNLMLGEDETLVEGGPVSRGNGDRDVVVMDDFIYGEPLPLEEIFADGFEQP